MPEVVVVPIDGELDLHTYSPREVGQVLPEYFAECRKRGILEVRVVHGKGKGALRRGVEAVLERRPEVASWRTAGHDRGSWGATLVQLRPLNEEIAAVTERRGAETGDPATPAGAKTPIPDEPETS